MKLKNGLRLLLKYPSATVGLALIAALIALAIYALIAIPFSEAVRLWRGGEGVWIEYPRNARPSWFNLWPGVNLPPTIIVRSDQPPATKELVPAAGGLTEARIVLPFNFPYDGFPTEINVFFNATFRERPPLASLTWHTPDGREIRIGDQTVRLPAQIYRISQDERLQRRLRGEVPHVGLFKQPGVPERRAQQGRYELHISALLFEEGAFTARLIVYGQVHGLAGTDHLRRDLVVGLLWGTPIALAFGLLAALGSAISTMIIAAIGVWFGRWVDAGIQRITEVNMILPVLPILIMIGTFYSRSIWVILGAVVALSIFSAAIKTYRAMFLQIKESPYIEAARAYGAGNLRIVFRYMIPKVVPVLAPQFVVLIPTFVFLEASLAILGLGDPVLPTWGKILNDAYRQGALFRGYYYWVLAPSVLLMLTGLGFAMVGFTLDRIFNPRLRTV